MTRALSLRLRFFALSHSVCLCKKYETAYGQTGSGKTFTIQGVNDSVSSASSSAGTAAAASASPNELRGLMPRVFEYLTAQIAREEARVRSGGSKVTFALSASFLEIYNEKCCQFYNKPPIKKNTGA